MLQILADGTSQLEYSNRQVSDMVNLMDPVYQRLTAAGRFPPKGGVGKYIEISRQGTQLRMIPASPDGAPSALESRKPGDKIILEIPSFPVKSTVTAAAIRGIIAAGQTNPQTMAEAVATELETLRMQIDLTREYTRVSALKGIIRDGADSVLYNLYDHFAITPKVINFSLGTAGTNVRAKCNELVKHIRTKMLGDIFQRVQVDCASDFFEALINHANVEKFYIQHLGALELASSMRPKTDVYQPREFTFAGVTFVEIVEQVTKWDGTALSLIADGKGHAAPLGTRVTEKAFVAPPIDITQLNGSPASVSDLVHVTQKMLDHNEGIELKAQLNELPVHQRPDCLVECLVA